MEYASVEENELIMNSSRTVRHNKLADLKPKDGSCDSEMVMRK